ncbi:MAG: HEAT repeat domain-containing protein [Gemmataceae bacterium]
MPGTVVLLFGLGWLVAPAPVADPALCEPDLPRLQKMLENRQDNRSQAQAAILLVQCGDPAAEALVRKYLQQIDAEEAFIPLAGAIRSQGDARFSRELFKALGSAKPRIRQAAGDALASLANPEILLQLKRIAGDPREEMRRRMMAMWIMGRCGKKEAAGILVSSLEDDSEELRRFALSGLVELTGQNLGTEIGPWKTWWNRNQNLSHEEWLQLRLNHLGSRAQRMEAELARAQGQVLRLHQQLYARLPLSDRFAHLQALLEQEDAAVKVLAVSWCADLLPSLDGEKLRHLSRVLLKLTHDGSIEVQQAAVLSLGRMASPEAFDRLRELLHSGLTPIRAAAVRAMAFQARAVTSDKRPSWKKVVPLLQKALEDRELEVVVESAEALGMLGAPEAGPVLIGLLRHPSEHVRQTAAQALERTADPSLLEGLLRGLEDPAVMVRFSLLGAVARAAGTGQTLTPEARKRLYDRLEGILRRDPDVGVRSRVATVLGDCGSPDVLETLWQQADGEDTEPRVQEKAWDAIFEVLARSGIMAHVVLWDRRLQETGKAARRVQLWSRVSARCEQQGPGREETLAALEALAQAHQDAGKPASAAPVYLNLLSRTAADQPARRERYLKALATILGKQVQTGARSEVLPLLQEIRAYLGKNDPLIEVFEKIERQARGQGK